MSENNTVEKSKASSCKWVEEYCQLIGVGYNILMEAAKKYLREGMLLDVGVNFFSLKEEFWDHFEIITDQAVPHEERGDFFTCAELRAEMGNDKSIESYVWIKNYSESIGISNEILVLAAQRYLKSGGPLEISGFHYINEEFWDHFEIVTGEKVPLEKRWNVFEWARSVVIKKWEPIVLGSLD